MVILEPVLLLHLIQVTTPSKMSYPPHLNRLPQLPPGICPPQFAGFPQGVPAGEIYFSLSDKTGCYQRPLLPEPFFQFSNDLLLCWSRLLIWSSVYILLQCLKARSMPVVWTDHNTVLWSGKMQQIGQNKAARIVLRCSYDSSDVVMHNDLGWSLINKIIEEKKTCLFYFTLYTI